MVSSKKPRRGGIARRRRSVLSRVVRLLVAAVVLFYAFVILSLFLLRSTNPLTTAVQAERRLESLLHRKTYRKVYIFVPIDQIAPALQHAVVAAEDARFFQHHGFDWKQVETAVEEDLDRGKSRGASTITQQLVKNLFLTTSRS